MANVLHTDSGVEDPTEYSSDRTYVLVAIFLAVMTAMEVAAAESESALGVVYVPSIIILMVIKFVMVAAYFMHLKDDPIHCQRIFGFGVSVASIIFVIMLATFHFWIPGFR